jgi:hypothetical protein
MTCEIMIGKYCLEYILILDGIDIKLLWIFCFTLLLLHLNNKRRIKELEDEKQKSEK